MAASWGSNKNKLPAGRYLFHITGVELTEGTDFKDKSIKIPQFKWLQKYRQSHQLVVDANGNQHWAPVNGDWQEKPLWTGRSFQDPNSISEPQFVPKLMRLCRACQVAMPMNAEEAARWDEQQLVGRRYLVQVTPDVETGVLVEKWLQYQAPIPEGALSPAAVNGSRQANGAGSDDPFVGDAGATAAGGHGIVPSGQPAMAGAGVTGSEDRWL